jgi:maleate isomerase
MKLPFETDQGIGTRATLGAIVLETDETLEKEFGRIMDLEGVALHHSRIPMVPEIREDTLQQMARDIPASAALLPSAARFDVVGYGCTSAATVIGPARVAELVRQARPEAKVTDPLTAARAALSALGARRLGFVTPYQAEVSARMRAALEDTGIQITAFGSFEEGDDRVVARITERSIADAIRSVAAQAGVDAVFVACTNLRCLRVITEVEPEIDRPILSSNQALGWHMLRLAGIDEPMPKFGRLFQYGMSDG